MHAPLAAYQPLHSGPAPSPDPYSRFLDRSSIYYDDVHHATPSTVPTSLRSPDVPFRSTDWSDSLPFLPLHYAYPNPMTLPDMNTPEYTPPTTSDITQSIRTACANSSRAASSRTSKQEGGAAPRPREKKHGCWMCEKSFDRPSTLKKHLLVHTGEKAFVCDTCGRRFGVASNLNRHVKRCILKPVNATNRTQMPPSPPPISDPPIPTDSPQKRPRTDDTPDSPTTSKPPAKRRRRAPSPSQWIPHSLADFNITPAEYTKPTSVPLPPVAAYRDPSSEEWVEERNSWDENAASPYHPCGWKGSLPGPGVGLGGKDVMNLGLVNGGTYVMGRLVMV